jgi:hypothetical protein
MMTGIPKRIPLAVTGSAVLGGVLSAIAIMVLPLFAAPVAGEARTLADLLVGVLFIGLFATVFFAFGIAIVGLPCWYVLLRIGLTGRMPLALLAAILVFSLSLFLFDGWSVTRQALKPHGIPLFALCMGMIGGLAGLVLWQIAHPGRARRLAS